MKQAIHKVIEIDPSKFEDQVLRDTDSGERIFNESDVLKFLIDAMNDAKINISMINHDLELAIEYRGRREYFPIVKTVSLGAPEAAVVDSMVELSYTLNAYEGIESWTSYKNGKHALHILRMPESNTMIKTAIKEMTDIEIREAEDNIESTME